MLEVLQTESQIAEARHNIEQKNVSFIDSKFTRALRHAGLVRGVSVGDYVKSWDVLRTLDFVQAHVRIDEPVADIGCYASEVLVALHRLGYRKLTGFDLNPALAKMPHSDCINYVVSDFKKTPHPDGSFKAITSISVIEHGFDGDALLREMSRLLLPGGFFLASFDYWPEKIDTSSTKFFDMDWLIFSQEDVKRLLDVAASHGLRPVGSLDFGAKDTPIHCAGKDYTFGLLVLRKDA